VALGLAAAAAFVLRPQVRRERGLDVLLVTMDTLRADALGAYGNARSETPWIDRLAREGARFEAAHAQNVVTLPSHANILSGRYPLQHGVRDNSGFRFPAETASLATILKGAGYRTGAFVSAFPLDARFGLGRGFDRYDDRLGNAETHAAFHMQERRGVDTVAAAKAWLESQTGAPTFCWVHLYEPHFPYEPPEGFAARFRDDPYLGEVAAADDALRPLLAPLLDSGRKGRTLVVLTADHGESRGEHGETTHGIFAYEATLRVPLIIYGPRIVPPGVIRDEVRHVDILPTVLDALELPVPADLPGTSLLALASGVASPAVRASYFESLSASLNRGWAPLRGAIKDHLKYIDLPVPELYDLAADPHETRNLAAANPGRLEASKALLAGFRSGEKSLDRVAESAQAREALQALGYVSAPGGAPPPAPSGVEDDPKNLIPLDAQVQSVVDHYRAGDLEGAIRIGEDLVRRRPGMSLVFTHLAFLYRQKGDLGAAVNAGRRALALNPEDTEAVGLIGAYLVEAGRPREALKLLEPYARRAEPDPDVLTSRGMAMAALGETQAALETFERARTLAPANAMNLVNIGTTYLMAGDRGRAQQALLAALDLAPDLARAHNSLGVIAAQEGRLEEAVARWRQALAADPRDSQTLFNLATTLRRQGHHAEARAFFERYVKEAPATEARDVAAARAWLKARPRTSP
jgi:arylsulfatase A-like enzyme/Tfp pilus assembly protein PilF